MYIKLVFSLFSLGFSLAASSAGLGFNPFQKQSSPTSPGSSVNQKPPVTAPSQSTQPSKPPAPVSVAPAKTDTQSKK